MIHDFINYINLQGQKHFQLLRVIERRAEVLRIEQFHPDQPEIKGRIQTLAVAWHLR
ncbi:hypothetical protein D3C73_1485860 [compost metagenome]